MSLKNILFLHAGAELYGADIILLEVLKGINTKEYKPFVILPNDGPLVEKIKSLNIDVKVEEYPILRRQFFTPIGILKYIYKLISSTFLLKKFIIENNIEIIHSNTLAVIEGGLLYKITGKKHIWHVHEIIKHPQFLSKFFKIVAPRMSSKVVCVSEAVKENLIGNEAKNSEKFVVIHNGIDEQKFTPASSEKIRRELSLPEDEILIGMIGRVNKTKGQEFLVGVAEKIIEKYKNVSFYIVGSVFAGQEHLMDNLRNKIDKPILKNKIFISEFRNDTVEIYNNLDIFVLPSVAPDSFPTVVLEAMGTGLPVIANVTGGVKEMVKDDVNGFLIYDISEDEMVRKLEILIEDKDLRETFGKNSRAIIEEKFNLAKFHEEFYDVYR